MSRMRVSIRCWHFDGTRHCPFLVYGSFYTDADAILVNEDNIARHKGRDLLRWLPTKGPFIVRRLDRNPMNHATFGTYVCVSEFETLDLAKAFLSRVGPKQPLIITTT